MSVRWLGVLLLILLSVVGANRGLAQPKAKTATNPTPTAPPAYTTTPPTTPEPKPAPTVQTAFAFIAAVVILTVVCYPSRKT